MIHASAHTHHLRARQTVCASMLVGVCLVLDASAQAPAPQFINYDGQVAVNGMNFKGVGQFKFALVNPGATATYWSNDGSSTDGSEPATAVFLTVTKGRYSVLLGDTSLAHMASLPPSVLETAELRLRVWFDDGQHGSQLLTPDQRIDATAGEVDPTPGRQVRSGAAAVPTPDRWRRRNTQPSLGDRSWATSVWTGSEMIIWGGHDTLNDGYRYNPATKTWKAVTRLAAPSARTSHTAVWTGTEMIVWGGGRSDGGRYNPASDTWAPMSPIGAPSTRSGLRAVWTGTEMLVWGGGEPSARYNPASDLWRPITDIGEPSLRSRFTTVWTGREMIVWGGFSYVGGVWTHLDTGGRYDPVTDTWAPVSTNGAPAARYFMEHKALWTGSEMLVWGGQNNDFEVTDGGRYDPRLDTWTAISAMDAPPQYADTVWTGSEMIAWDGNGNGGRYSPVADVWEDMREDIRVLGIGPFLWTGTEMIRWSGGRFSHYNPSTDKWTLVGPFAARFKHTALWTGSELLVWGGTNSGRVSMFYGDSRSSVARWNPATDTWMQMSYTNAPRAYEDHAAVWTGAEMIVWGGQATDKNSGGRYNPAADTWAPVTAIGAPTPRLKHTAVWTGAEMIVWGGLQDSTYVNDGGRYNPTLGVWSTLPLAGAPASRASHSALWTGAEMIVWGGERSATTSHRDGGRFHVAQNRWLSLTTMDAPAARSEHTALWTGTEMIVWGGRDVATALNTGARYNPSTDRWMAVTPIGAPDSRSGHSAVWTGSEVVVWGGQRSGIALASGSRYDPLADAWNGIVKTGAPVPRWGHRAVWTGTEMLVCGGTNDPVGTTNPTMFNDLYSYSPGDGGLAITGLLPGDGALLISFPSETGCLYTLWRSDTLADGTWTDTGLPPVVGTGARLRFSVPATGIPRGFFRVQVSSL